MITLNVFLRCVQRNAARTRRYEKGGDGSGGGCDCIGLVIGALRLAGGKWPGTHGSNWAARNAVDGLERIHGPEELFLGEIVFKAHEPEEKGYDAATVNGSYRASPDRRDYYHVGVVTGTGPLEITHCTSVPGGIQRDNRLGAWKWGGRLQYVEYKGGDADMEEPLYRAMVTAQSGKTVRMRSGPGSRSPVVQAVAVGTEVEVLDVLEGWSLLRLDDGKTGYMMSKFLAEPASAPADADRLRAALESAEAALRDALTILDVLTDKEK